MAGAIMVAHMAMATMVAPMAAATVDGGSSPSDGGLPPEVQQIDD